MDFSLSPELLELQEKTRRFVADCARAERLRKRHFPGRLGMQLSLARDAATRGCQKGNEQACGILVGLFAQSGDPDVIRPAERACAPVKAPRS